MRKRRIVAVLFVVVAVFGLNRTSFGQWFIFQESAGIGCEVINAANVELVLLDGSNNLTIVSGPDVTLPDLEIDAEWNVYFAGQQSGFLTFADDGDNLRSLWWISLTGRVVDVNPLNGSPSETDLFPEDFRNAGCDACEYWDDQTICQPVEEPPPLIDVTLCAQGMILPMFMMVSALTLVKAQRRRGFVSRKTTPALPVDSPSA